MFKNGCGTHVYLDRRIYYKMETTLSLRRLILYLLAAVKLPGQQLISETRYKQTQC